MASALLDATKMLVASAFVSNWFMTPFAIAAAATVLFGPKMGNPAHC